MTAQDIIKKLDLQPHEMEGGFFRETYRSSDIVASEAVPKRYVSNKAFSTAIYYLLTPDTFSEMHLLPTDEIFHFYMGDPVEMLILETGKEGHIATLGNDLESSVPQLIVEKDIWQGCRLKEGGKFCLMGTTVAPAFDFSDYQRGDRANLSAQYPEFTEMITALTHS